MVGNGTSGKYDCHTLNGDNWQNRPFYFLGLFYIEWIDPGCGLTKFLLVIADCIRQDDETLLKWRVTLDALSTLISLQKEAETILLSPPFVRVHLCLFLIQKGHCISCLC